MFYLREMPLHHWYSFRNSLALSSLDSPRSQKVTVYPAMAVR
ncbi:unnamed protein product [Acidithrix sp. C25]|nr:unnamed protein product [Acidithrix sp. C25]